MSNGNKCSLPYFSSNIEISASSEYSILASTSNILGYDEDFCILCVIQPDGQLPSISFYRENIKISAIANGDCKQALKKKEFAEIEEISFKENGSMFQISQSYNHFFNHLYQDSCLIHSCTLRESGNCEQVLKQTE